MMSSSGIVSHNDRVCVYLISQIRELEWDPFPRKIKQFIAERDVYHVLLENGKTYVFKPARDEDPDEERLAYIP